jgi:hypothetical protein
VLEHHADLGPHTGGFLFPQLVEGVLVLPVSDEFPAYPEPAAVDLFQVVDAAQERGFARARWPDDAVDLAGIDLKADAPQDLEPPEALVYVFGEDGRGAG